MRTHIIYIPGLGDRYDGFRRFGLQTWRWWGVTAQHVPISWYDGGTMRQKLDRIEAAIQDVPSGHRIVLIGESAGASLALQYSSDTRIDRIITLCGVARSTTPVSSYLRRRAPALDEAVGLIPHTPSVDTHSVRATVDGVVGKKYSTAGGARQHVVWSIGHLTTILLCLTIYAPIITAIAKNQK